MAHRLTTERVTGANLWRGRCSCGAMETLAPRGKLRPSLDDLEIDYVMRRRLHSWHRRHLADVSA